MLIKPPLPLVYQVAGAVLSLSDFRFTVTIPSALALSKDGTALNIEAKDVADLDGKKVSVTIVGTDY